MQWAYGVTTVPERHATYLPTTLKSLAAAGFDRPWLFVDGAPHGCYDSSGYRCSYRFPKTNLVTNWTLALTELLHAFPTAERFAIFQDDVRAVKNLRTYLSRCELKEKTYWNLVTFKANEHAVAGQPRGWHPSLTTRSGIHRGIGLLGTVLTRQGVWDLLCTPSFVMKSASAVWPHRNMDGCIADCLSRQGYVELVHSPSPLTHTGLVSSKENNGVSDHADARTFPGEDCDAADW